MSCIPKKDRRPSHEFLSEFSISQKLRNTNEKQNLKLTLNRLDSQRKRSLDVIDSERRKLCASILQQHEADRRRLLSRRLSSASDEYDQNANTQEDHLRTRRGLEESTSGGRSVSVDLGKQGRRLSMPMLSERIPRSAGTLRRPSMDVQELERPRNSMSPERVLSLSQRRNSDTSTVTPANFCTRSNGRRLSFSQSPDNEMPSPRTPNITNSVKRRMSMPVLFPTLNTGAISNHQVSRSLDSPKETPRVIERRHSLNAGQFRIPRRYSTKKLIDTSVAKMAGMHGVMQRTSMFQIQENEAVEEV